MAKQLNFDDFHGDTPVRAEHSMMALGEPHLACVLLLDVSGSMYGQPIDSLRESLSRFRDAVCKDELARKRVDVALVTFSDTVEMVSDGFIPVERMEHTYYLEAHGQTKMAEGIIEAVSMVRQRNHEYENLGVDKFPSWIFLITDGQSSSFDPEMEQAIELVKQQENAGRLKFWALGTGDYDSRELFRLTNRVIELREQQFEGIFDWLSESMVAIANSRVGDTVPLNDLPVHARKADPNRSIDEDWY